MVCDRDLSTMNEMKFPHPQHISHLLCASASQPMSFTSTLKAWGLLGSGNSCCLKILNSATSHTEAFWNTRYSASPTICSVVSKDARRVWTCCHFGFSSIWLQDMELTTCCFINCVIMITLLELIKVRNACITLKLPDCGIQLHIHPPKLKCLLCRHLTWEMDKFSLQSVETQPIEQMETAYPIVLRGHLLVRKEAF